MTGDPALPDHIRTGLAAWDEAVERFDPGEVADAGDRLAELLGRALDEIDEIDEPGGR